MVHPVVLGGGKRLFEDGADQTALELVDSKTSSTSATSRHGAEAIREAGISYGPFFLPYSPSAGYRYDGLYLVDD